MCVRSYATLGSYFTFLSIGFKKLKALGTRTQSYLIFKDAELNTDTYISHSKNQLILGKYYTIK